ncbi:MAG: hypothetical protein L0G70_08545 [Rubrobacter sp.]|nr:hypothetical protein [Rubrobacter sp.]
MRPEFSTAVLASYNSRSRIVREDGGGGRLFWGVLSVGMSVGEFVEFALMLSETGGVARRGELARCACGRVDRCAMGQIMVSHESLTLWFEPDEFEDFGRLVDQARQRLADSEPPPALGVPWEPRGEFFGVS